MRVIIPLLTVFVFSLYPILQSSAEDKSGTFVNAVVASVDGKPITVSDVNKKLNRSKPLTLSEIASDSDAKRTVEDLILERAISEEASARGFKVHDSEVEEYMNSVAKQNNLSREDFEKAVVEKGKSLPDYKNEIKVEILKSKLASSVVKRSVSVTDEEIKSFLSNAEEMSSPGSNGESGRVVLHHIFIDTKDRSDDEALDRLRNVKEKLESGEDFEDLAKEFSDAPDASSGGDLGAVAVSDLERDIYSAISNLSEGEISKPIPSESGIRFVKLIERQKAPEKEELSDEEKEAKARYNENAMSEAKKFLENKKYEGKLLSFFTEDLLKEHSVDRKI